MRESGATRILLGKILDFFLLVIMTRYRHALAFFFFFFNVFVGLVPLCISINSQKR